MAAYVIVDLRVTEPEGYERYKQLAPATIEQYGGRYIARGGRCQTLEGDWQPQRVVVLEFESFERAEEWWNSPEYEAPKALRQRTAETRMILVEGF